MIVKEIPEPKIHHVTVYSGETTDVQLPYFTDYYVTRIAETQNVSLYNPLRRYNKIYRTPDENYLRIWPRQISEGPAFARFAVYNRHSFITDYIHVTLTPPPPKIYKKTVNTKDWSYL